MKQHHNSAPQTETETYSATQMAIQTNWTSWTGETLLFRIGFSNKDSISLLAHKHSEVVGSRILKRLCRKLCLFRMKNHTGTEEMASWNWNSVDNNDGRDRMLGQLASLPVAPLTGFGGFQRVDFILTISTLLTKLSCNFSLDISTFFREVHNEIKKKLNSEPLSMYNTSRQHHH